MRKLLLTAAVVVAAVSGAAAEDDVYPYRESGPERDLFIQSSIKTCVNHNMWKNMGSESEVKAFCECKALNLAEKREDTRRSPQQDQTGPGRLREALQQAAKGPRSIKVSPSARGHLRVASLLREQDKRLCGPVAPSIAPINPPTIPPLGTTSCRQAQTCDQFGNCRWQQVCR